MKPTCRDCLWRDFPAATGFCRHPERRHSDNATCEHWEWRYE